MQQQNPLANIRYDQTTGVICESCKGTIFSEAYMLRKVSKFLTLSTSNKDQVIPVPVFYCVKCNHVNKEFLPFGAEEEQKEDE